MKTKTRAIAFYLPQYYPTPENDEWWEKGFTEWTNVTKALPIFPGHHQPNLPSELGFYDLRIPEVREQQADLARNHGIEGFCYWHYWFGNGKRILDRVFKEVLESGKPDFPFCLAWANETWKGLWHGLGDKPLAEQTYPGIEDYTAHFYEVLPAFKDPRYIRVHNKPLFMIYRIVGFQDGQIFINLWQKLAKENGLDGIYFVGQVFNYRHIDDAFKNGVDAVNEIRLNEIQKHLPKAQFTLKEKIINKIKNIPNDLQKYNYEEVIKYLTGEETKRDNVIPTIFPNWDHSPRSKGKTFIAHNSTPEFFRKHIKEVIEIVEKKPAEKNLVFIKSWNEWAEGNYMEPDRRYGRKYLEVFKEENKR